MHVCQCTWRSAVSAPWSRWGPPPCSRCSPASTAPCRSTTRTSSSSSPPTSSSPSLQPSSQVKTMQDILKSYKEFIAMICNFNNITSHILWELSTNLIPAAIATLAAVLISIPQFLLRKQEFTTEPGACYYIEVVLVFINLLLCVVSYLSYAKARKTNFPKQRNPYEISADNYR